MTDAFARFRASLPRPDQIHDGLIGRDAVIEGPFGPRPMIYADYIASGRAHEAVERFVMTEVLPWYANSHTEASHCGGTMTRLRRAARAEVLAAVGGDADHAAIFCGAGATAGINKLVGLWRVGPGATVLIGPYEHHSNILPWRESGARVIEIAEDPVTGGPCRAALEAALGAAEGPLIGAFSVASNVTGILSDVAGITARLKAAGARVVWDYAGGGPYLPIDMGQGMDAIVLSPHKFIGGPGASGLLVMRRDSVLADRPTTPGGGTVRFVNAEGQDYANALESREESGTPNVIGDIRAALALILKGAVGCDHIAARNAERWALARDLLAAVPGIELLGNRACARLPILSFRLRDGKGGFVHQQLATRMLSDLYGIQARGGCACAGPYVHRLLAISDDQSARMRQAILAGAELEKPGFVRLSLCWAAPDSEVTAILASLADLAARAPGLAGDYAVDPARAIFTPRDEAA
ncbi:aminotransferase class V-fold PLP-dependent enzyme [Paracoccus sp. p4-l81]|uniref:aminotransferase class V-fold PLP-dependent enzyme n=1 Tax=unclassified Paracoccus (in: a-proteobacteria) TaxID=2688777 RepID=UPI0035B6FC5F